MSLHLMLILLSFVEPKHVDMELVPAPQVVAPASLWEDQHTLKQIRYIKKLKQSEEWKLLHE